MDDVAATMKETIILHETIKKIKHDIESFSFNTCVSTFMITTNQLKKLNCRKKEILEPLLILLSPFAPFICEEIWNKIYPKELVLNKEEWGDGKENYIESKSLREGWTWFEREWTKASNDTGIGNPSNSSKEKGEKYFNDVVNKVSSLIDELCRLNLKKMYTKI